MAWACWRAASALISPKLWNRFVWPYYLQLVQALLKSDHLVHKLDALPEDYRQVILLAKLEGLTTQEVAERMGKSRETVALLLHRALQRFRQLDQREPR